jgi:uncharacterized Ntn-hydrolase superfamily protein
MQLPSLHRTWRRCAVAALSLGLLATPALATWSIVVVNTRTREVCVASATCLANFNLKKALPVIKIGLGCGAAQSQIDVGAVARMIMWSGFANGAAPQDILTQISTTVSMYEGRQYGIVDMTHDPVTFTGTDCGLDATGVTGIVGDLRYAIQGNVIVDDSLVYIAQDALLNTPGDLSQKVMAAMEAARAIGGDGRCSCNLAKPNSCSPLPPPAPFKSAHVGFIVLGRIGDTGATTCDSNGCAPGSLYITLNIVAGVADVDPVIQLEGQYAAWRAAMIGRPDQVLSQVHADAEALVADGHTATSVNVRLFDVDGNPIAHGGHTLTLQNISGVPAITTPSAVVDHGDGSYGFSLTAGSLTGADVWRIVANDGVGNVTLYPDLRLQVDPLAPLHAGYASVSVAQGANVPFVINQGGSSATRPYLLLATTTGTQPGLPFAGTQLPLNMSPLLGFTYTHANTRYLPNSFRNLDKQGRGEARFIADANFLQPYAGAHIDWSAVIFDPFQSSATPPVGVDVLP